MPGRARALPRAAPDPTRACPAGTRARGDLHTDPDRRNVYMRILTMPARSNGIPVVCGHD